MLSFIFVLSAVHLTLAANDWSKACTDSCSWDVPDSSSSGSVRVWGDKPGAIGDITPAGGFKMLTWNPDVLDQDVRVVCMDPTKCNQLNQGGVEDTLVRMPKGCKGPFAVVSKVWVHANQTLPADVKTKLQRRGGPAPVVQGMTLHTNWSSVPAKKGSVNFSVLGYNAPGYNDQTGAATSQTSKRSLVARGIFDDIGKAITKAGDAVVDTGKKAVDAVADTGKKAADAVKDTATTVVDKGKDAVKAVTTPLNVNKNISKSFDLNFDNKNLLNLDVTCNKASLSVQVDASSKSHADVTLGAIASGTIIPPKFDDFALLAGLTADLSGTINIAAQANGVVDSGQIKVFEIGIPGFDIPGILSLGPSFQVNTQARANIDIQLDMSVDLAYKVDGALLFFPQSAAHKNIDNFKPTDSPLKLSVPPALASKLTLEAHLIPEILVGVSAFGKTVSADVNLSLDASAILGLSLEAGGAAPLDSPPPITPVLGVKGPAQGISKGPAAPAKAPAKAPTKAPTKGTPTKASKAASSKAPAKTSAPKSSAKAVAPKPKSSAAKAAPAKKPAATTTAAPKKAPASASKPAQTSSKVIKARKAAAKPAKAPASTAKAAKAAPTAGGVASGLASAAAAVKDKAAAAGVGGCVDLKGGLKVSAGASANFFSFFNKGTQIVFFNKQFQLFKKCFGADAQKRSLSVPETPAVMYSRPRHLLLRKRASLTCPITTSSGLQNPVTLIQQTLTNLVPI